MSDRIHVLTATGSLLLTKRIHANGSVTGHGEPKWHKLNVVEVGDFWALSALLTKLESRNQSCVVRGVYIGDAAAAIHHEAEDDYRAGLLLRRKSVVFDQRLHSVMFDVDKFSPLFADPVLEPESAFREYIETHLPAAFHTASFHWQLSSSAGRVGSEGKLKGHLWFWLDTPASSSDLKVWAKCEGLAVDTALFDPIQAHYTAAPVFDEGVPDPVPCRSGTWRGARDAVVIEIANRQSSARLTGVEEVCAADEIAAHLYEKGLVKSFNRNKGGLNITCPNADQHSGPSGETSTVYVPSGGEFEVGNFICQHEHCRDVPRVRFLELLGLGPQPGDASGFDDVEPEQVREVQRQVSVERREQAEVSQKEQQQKAAHAMQRWLHAVEASESIEELQLETCKRIAADRTVGDIHRALLAEAVQTRLDALGATVPVAVCRKLVAYRSEERREPTVLKKRPLTEFGNAERMLDRYGDNLMYVPELEAWYIWSEKPDYRWRRASDVEIEHWAKETIRGLAKEADEYHSDEDRGAFFEFCKISQQARMVRNMVTLAASEPKVCVPARELDKDPFLLGVRNGIVDLRTGALLPPDKSARITLIAGCDYDPKAEAPLFERTLREVFSGDEELTEYMLRVFGYALLGQPTEDIMVIAFGNGANGKSTITNAVRKTFGGYARAAEASSFVSDGKQGGAGGAREDLVRLRGARLVYVNEPDENGELREGAVKSMTGGDTITARGLYAKDSVEIAPTWTVIMPTNHKPIIKGSDNGIWRRMVMIPFERNFENDPTIQKDPKREEKLLGEMRGILTLLVQAALRYQRDGLTPPAQVRAARDAYRSQMDLLAEWLEESCDVGPEYQCPSASLWGSWEQFAKGRGLLRYIPSSTALGRRLDARFPAKKGAKGVRARVGLQLKSHADLFDG